MLGLVGRDRLGEDVPRDPVMSTFESLPALAVDFVPSIATTWLNRSKYRAVTQHAELFAWLYLAHLQTSRHR